MKKKSTDHSGFEPGTFGSLVLLGLEDMLEERG